MHGFLYKHMENFKVPYLILRRESKFPAINSLYFLPILRAAVKIIPPKTPVNYII